MEAKILGLFFNRVGTQTPTPDDEPDQELTIKKDDLDHSSGMFEGRLSYAVDGSHQLVWLVDLDGKRIYQGGQNIPAESKSGIIDVNLFPYPNTAAAGKAMVHKVTVTPGLRKGFWASVWNLELPSVQWFPPVTFPITLLPNGPRD